MRLISTPYAVAGALALAGAAGLSAQSGTYPIHGDDVATLKGSAAKIVKGWMKLLNWLASTM